MTYRQAKREAVSRSVEMGHGMTFKETQNAMDGTCRQCGGTLRVYRDMDGLLDIGGNVLAMECPG